MFRSPYNAVLATLFISICLLSINPAQAATPETHALILLNSGATNEGDLNNRSVSLIVDGTLRNIRLSDVLSIQSGAVPTPVEKQLIEAGITAITGTDRQKGEAGAQSLVDIGLPSLSAMLAAQDPTDTDLHEPHLLYSLFARIIPAGGDRLDRSLDMVRLADGKLLRGKLVAGTLTFTPSDGKRVTMPLGEIRRILIRRPIVTRSLAVHSLRHCTQIAWLDTGVILTSGSKVESNSEGIVRLSFNLDKWTATPDGLIRPDATGQKIVIDGFPFGALLARVGASGDRKLLGSRASKTDLKSGRLYLAINDNGHWQNNIGSYLVRMHILEAYDAGEPGE